MKILSAAQTRALDQATIAGQGITSAQLMERAAQELLFWFYGHQAVYLPLMPAIAVLYTLLPRFLGRPVWSYWSGVNAVAFLLRQGKGVDGRTALQG